MLATKEETVEETQRRAIELGLTGEQVRNGVHSWYNHSSTGNIGSATIEFLKDRILKGESAIDAFEKIKGVNNEFKIQAIQLGLNRKDLEGHSWYNHSSTGNIGSATIEFLKDRISKGESPLDAFEKIKGVNNEFKIQAIQLGLNREDLEGLDWSNTDSNFYQGSATIEYLRKCPVEVTLKRALANIKGDKRGMQKIIDNQNAGITAGLDPIQVYAVPLTTNQIIKITNGELYDDVVPEGAKFISQLKQREQAPNTTFNALDTTNLTTTQNTEIGKGPQR